MWIPCPRTNTPREKAESPSGVVACEVIAAVGQQRGWGQA